MTGSPSETPSRFSLAGLKSGDMESGDTLPSKLVTAAILRRGHEVLIARRGPQMNLAGMWEFAGGKVEKNETPEECLTRELREELCIEAEVGPLVCSSDYTYDHGSFRILAYESRVLAGQPTPTEHDELAWVHPDHLRSYKLLPADIPIAEHLASQST